MMQTLKIKKLIPSQDKEIDVIASFMFSSACSKLKCICGHKVQFKRK